MDCPICKKPCEAIQANDNGASVTVQRCTTHGKMKIANKFTDAYMTVAHPDLRKGNDGGYYPSTDGLPTVESL